MKRKRFLSLLLTLMMLGAPCCAEEVEQMNIRYMQDWPALPTPFTTRDWQQTTRTLAELTLDPAATAPLFPVTSLFEQASPLSGGFSGESFGTSTYLRADNALSGYGEAVTQLSTVLTAALTDGIDPRSLHDRDYVRMVQTYFSRTPDGRGFVSNNTPADDCTGSFWYTLYPTLLYFHLCAQYPEDAALTVQMKETADTWLDALSYIHTWDVQGVSLRDRCLVRGGHTEPEGMVGAAYVMLMAHARFGDEAYLTAATSLMAGAARRETNPYYEILGSYAPVIAARLNAEQNAGLPLERMLDWVFTDGTECARSGWGMMRGRFGEYDAHGLSGSLSDTAGYAFAMNTFVTAGALAPVARYAPWYSRVIGQYLTAVVSNSHMFFADGLPAKHQDDAAYTAEAGLSCLVYEGVRSMGRKTPFATGDAKPYGGTGTNFSFYSSGPIGMLSAMIVPTDVPEILAFDLLKTDFEHGTAYPTYLLYNPLAEMREVALPVPSLCDVYDAVTGRVVMKGAQGTARLTIPAGEAVQAVLIPAGAALTESDGRVLAEGVVVRHADRYLTVPEIAEGDLLDDVAVIHPRLKGDAAVSWRLTYGDRLLAEGATLPGSLMIDPSQLPLGRDVLMLQVNTVSGSLLTWAAGIKTVPAGARRIFHYNAEDLTGLFTRTNNVSLRPVEEGLRFKVTSDWARFDCPAVTVRAAEEPMLLVDVPSAVGAWGVFAVVDGAQHYLQRDCAGRGQFLYDLGDLLTELDLAEAEVVIAPFVSGKGTEMVLRRMELIRKSDESIE